MEVFVARQPIFDRNQKVFGYELLYRVGFNNVYQGTDGNLATSEVIANSFLLFGLDTITGGKRAFINFTHDLLMNGLPTNLPNKYVAVEVLEDVKRDKELVEQCKKLKQLGYLIVLDDFVCEAQGEPLIELADIVKIDFLATTEKERKSFIKTINRQVGLDKVKFLAEKVETREEFEKAVNMGYSYFQGYFFNKPVILSSRDVPVNKLNYLQIIQEINQTDLDFNHLENIIKRDVSLAYKLLKYINSASFGFRTRIKSIKHALVMLGAKEIKKWVTLIALRNLAKDKPEEILVTSIMRARFGELIAEKLRLREESSEVFLLGLFSMIDVIIGRPMSAVLTGLPISEEVKNALMGQESKYSDILNMIKAYEKGEFENFFRYSGKFKLNEIDIPELYINSLEWANAFIDTVESSAV